MKKYMQLCSFAVALAVGGFVLSWATERRFADSDAVIWAQPVEFVSVKDRERQLKCMADNIYFEAATEPTEGKIAVAQIVMNRVDSADFPNDPCAVIYQKNVFYQRVVCQFSWYCDGSAQRQRIRQDLWREGYDAAVLVMMEGFRLPSLQNALYYHADYVNPQWRKTQVAKIGRHIFYQPRGV